MMHQYTPPKIETLKPGEVFVFGSNPAGHHSGGAARLAFERFGAVWGQAQGLQGQSYAIDSMSGLQTLADQAREFILFTRTRRRDLTFLVTEIGCGIAGYTPLQVAPLFVGFPPHVVLPFSFRMVLG